MHLLRNITPDGSCKYSLVQHEKNDTIEAGLPNTEHEFFVLKLKDKYAQAALNAYVEAVEGDDPEYAEEVRELANRAGEDSPWCHTPT